MKSISTLLLSVACLLCACHHHDNSADFRRYTPRDEYRRTDTPTYKIRTPGRSTRQHRRTQAQDNMESLPFLPPFTMRWDCPPEPQMLGYAMR